MYPVIFNFRELIAFWMFFPRCTPLSFPRYNKYPFISELLMMVFLMFSAGQRSWAVWPSSTLPAHGALPLPLLYRTPPV